MGWKKPTGLFHGDSEWQWMTKRRLREVERAYWLHQD